MQDTTRTTTCATTRTVSRRHAMVAMACAATLGSPAVRAQGQPDILVHSIVCATGPGSFYGVAVRQGTDLAVEEINRAGGVGGRQIKVEHIDDASNPAEAANIARRIAGDAKLVLLNTITTVSAVALPLLNQLKIPAAGPQISVPKFVQENRPYTFSFFPDITKGAGSMIKAWMEDRKVKSVVIVEDQADIPSRTQGEMARNLIAQNGGTVAEVINITTGAVNFSPIISRIRALNPSGVYISTLSNDAAGLLGEMRKADLKMARAMSIASYNPKALAGAGSGADGLYSYIYFLPTAEGGPDAVAFADTFKKRFGSEPVMQSALAYAMMKTIGAQLATANVGSGDLQAQRDRIRDSLAAIKSYKGPFGNVSMSADGIVQIEPIIVVFEDGKATRRK
ncbi:MAG TPA: ABC transporter substrate-binding protein [Ramlibacter sp.]|uniref:ABC transporter substrate-binding protein n=1 Tax=Ramlibacter sp. TaxID=1917967 RepID=UPI002C132D06|nr:ABC transporter substrate-binding protein [Ramlibacter sp.]HVZ42869.1 ABC transporter substrate-binding protein [Ramlibacter sp.]